MLLSINFGHSMECGDYTELVNCFKCTCNTGQPMVLSRTVKANTDVTFRPARSGRRIEMQSYTNSTEDSESPENRWHLFIWWCIKLKSRFWPQNVGSQKAATEGSNYRCARSSIVERSNDKQHNSFTHFTSLTDRRGSASCWVSGFPV